MIQLIIDNIYIGNWQDAQYHQREFKEIFTVAKDSPFVCNHFYGLVDGSYPENEKMLNFAIVDLIETRLQNKEKILVHCVSGVSRSTTVVAGYMIAKGYTTEDAIEYIKNIRSIANIVPELVRLLKKYETYLKEGLQYDI